MMDLRVFIFLLLSCITRFTVLHGQNVVTDAEVTAYQGDDVTLMCRYINTVDKITHIQWSWKNQSRNASAIIVFSVGHGLSLPDSFLKDRVNFSIVFTDIYDASIIIRDVMSDQGDYSCAYTTFPSGSHSGRTILKVTKRSPFVLSTVQTVGIVTIVAFIITITTAMVYLFLLNRPRAVSASTYFTTRSSDDPQQEITYADPIMLKKGKDNKRPSSVGESEYAAVSVRNRSGSKSLQASANQQASGVHTAEQETMYAEVKKGKQKCHTEVIINNSDNREVHTVT